MRKQSILQVLIAAGILAGLLMMQGCASLSYETQDGTKVTYRRLLTTSDKISVVLGDARLDVAKQQIDTALLQSILGVLAGAAR